MSINKISHWNLLNRLNVNGTLLSIDKPRGKSLWKVIAKITYYNNYFNNYFFSTKLLWQLLFFLRVLFILGLVSYYCVQNDKTYAKIKSNCKKKVIVKVVLRITFSEWIPPWDKHNWSLLRQRFTLQWNFFGSSTGYRKIAIIVDKMTCNLHKMKWNIWLVDVKCSDAVRAIIE